MDLSTRSFRGSLVRKLCLARVLKELWLQPSRFIWANGLFLVTATTSRSVHQSISPILPADMLSSDFEKLNVLSLSASPIPS